MTAGFPTTRWTLVLSARRGDGEGQRALAELLGVYWSPLYALARRRGLKAPDAQDAVQGFFAHLLEHEVVERLEPARGRLRGFLKTSFVNFMSNQHTRANARKRGGGLVMFDWDQAERQLAAGDGDPEQAFMQQWAATVMSRALARLEAEFVSGERRGPFEVVQAYFGAEPAPPYQETARRHTMSVPQLKAFLHRARTRFRQLVREEVADTVSEASDVEPEVSTLVGALP